MTARPPRLAWIAWIAICVIWGTTYLGIRIALETMPPAVMAALRWIVAGSIVSAGVWLRGGRLPGPAAWPGLALLGLLMIACGNGFVVYAEQFVPSGLTAVILATSPFWMVGVESMLPGGERPGAGAMIGLLVGFAGIVLLVWPDLHAGGAHAARFGLGILALQMACVAWACGSAYSRRHRHGEDVVGATALQMLFGGAIMAVVATVFGEWQWLSFTTRTVSAFAYLVIAGSLGGFLAYIYALRHLPVSTVSLYAYVNPVIAVVLGAAALGEPFGLRVLAAAGLVLAGSAFVRSSGHGPRGPASAASAERGPVASLLKRVTS